MCVCVCVCVCVTFLYVQTKLISRNHCIVLKYTILVRLRRIVSSCTGGHRPQSWLMYIYDRCYWQCRVFVLLCYYYSYKCEQVLFVYVSTLIPPCLTDQRNFFTVLLLVTREPEQTNVFSDYFTEKIRTIRNNFPPILYLPSPFYAISHV